MSRELKIVPLKLECQSEALTRDLRLAKFQEPRWLNNDLTSGAAQDVWWSVMVALIVSLAMAVNHLYPDVNKYHREEHITILVM